MALPIQIDPADATPIYAQLDRAIRVAIATGKMRPGDQLRFELTLLRLKQRICKMEGKAYVHGDLVAEAELLSSIVDRNP